MVVDVHRRRQREPDLLHGLAHPGRHLDGVGARLPLDGEHDAAGLVEPGGRLGVLHAVDHVAEVLQPHRPPVAPGHDERPELGGVLQLAGGLHGVGPVGAPEDAGGQVDVALVDRIAHLVDADLARRHGLGIELDPHGILLRAEHLHLRHPLHGGEPLADGHLPELVEL